MRSTFRKKLTASLIYPARAAITLVCALFVFLISFVVPQFAQLYDQIGSKLPSITLWLLAVGNFAQKYILFAPARSRCSCFWFMALGADRRRAGPH